MTHYMTRVGCLVTIIPGQLNLLLENYVQKD